MAAVMSPFISASFLHSYKMQKKLSSLKHSVMSQITCLKFFTFINIRYPK